MPPEKVLVSFSVVSLPNEKDHQAERIRLLSSLRDQTIHIPDLVPLFSHWPTKTNSALDHLRLEAQDWLHRTTPPGPVLSELLISDFGFFGATWWPCASFERLRIVTYLSIWLFVWDDEIDHSDGTMCDEFGAAQAYRNQTLAYMRYSLGLEDILHDPSITNPIILNFAPVGDALRSIYTREQRQRVYDTMQFFMNMSEHEQRLRLSGAIPSVEEFWRYRLGSSAVPVCLAFNELSWEGMDLPRDFYEDADVKKIQKYTNTIVSTVNDLLSLKKEIRRGAIDSLIPIYLHKVGDLQTAVDIVVAFLAGEIKAMDEAALSLFKRYETADEYLKRQVKDYVDGCKHYTTGNLTWSLETGRYGVECVDGKIVMKL
jgi:hypothetical protein